MVGSVLLLTLFALAYIYAGTEAMVLYLCALTSVSDPAPNLDPDPSDPCVFESPGSGSGSNSQRYGSGSGSRINALVL